MADRQAALSVRDYSLCLFSHRIECKGDKWSLPIWLPTIHLVPPQAPKTVLRPWRTVDTGNYFLKHRNAIVTHFCVHSYVSHNGSTTMDIYKINIHSHI